MSDTYTWLDKTFNFLSSNKDLVSLMLVFLSAIIGTFIGWLLNSRTVNTQLKHDAREREKDRQHQIIKEVYLDAFESISKMVLNLELLSPDDIKITIVKEKQSINLKDIDLKHYSLELVGSENTLKAFLKFTECYFETRTKLHQKLWLFYDIKLNLSEVNSQIEHWSKLSENLHDEIMALLKDPDHDKNVEEYLAGKNEELSDKISGKGSVALEITKEIGMMVLEYDNYKSITLEDLYFATSELAIEIRKDLKMILDESEYLIQIKEHQKRMKELYNDYAEKGKLLIKNYPKFSMKEE